MAASALKPWVGLGLHPPHHSIKHVLNGSLLMQSWTGIVWTWDKRDFPDQTYMGLQLWGGRERVLPAFMWMQVSYTLVIYRLNSSKCIVFVRIVSALYLLLGMATPRGLMSMVFPFWCLGWERGRKRWRSLTGTWTKIRQSPSWVSIWNVREASRVLSQLVHNRVCLFLA